MILFRNFIGFIAIAAILFACKKEMSSENANNPIVVDAKWEFKEAGTLFQGDIDTAFISRQPGFSVLTIEGKSKDNKNGVLLMQIGTDTIIPGTYASSDLFFQYSENGSVLYESVPGNPNFADFSIVIAAIDSASISGTFGGTVIGSDSAAHTIAEGKFSAEFYGSNTDTIPTDTIPTDPEPDPNLDYLPLGSSWTYGNLDDPGNDTVRVISNGEVELDGNTYTQFYNETLGTTRYFRKDTTAGIYYEYITPTNDFPLETPVEIIVLQENPEPNFSWESDEYTLVYTATGIETRIPVKLKSTNTAYNATYDINGKTYKNVIEVTSNILVKQQDGSYSDAGSYAITYFAKGIGIVAYSEQSTGVGYGIKHYTITP